MEVENGSDGSCITASSAGGAFLPLPALGASVQWHSKLARCSFLLALTQYIVNLCAGKDMRKWSHICIFVNHSSPHHSIACLLVSHFNSARESAVSLNVFFPVCAKSLSPRGYKFLKLFSVYSCALLNERDVCFLFPYLENTEIRSAYIFRAPGCFISRQIWVNFSGWWFRVILMWWAFSEQQANCTRRFPQALF